MMKSSYLLNCILCSLFLSNPILANEGSSMRRLMEASRPSLTVPFLQSMETSFPKSLLNIEATAFENVNLIEEEQDNSPMQNESSIAANPLDPRHLIASAVDYRDKQSAWVYVSNDGGYHWRNVNLGKPAGLNFIAGNDPSVAWDYQGRAYIVYGGFDATRTTGENAVLMSRSTDNGATWTKHIPVILHRGTMTKDSAFEDKYYISIDNAGSSPYKGHLYIPWKRVYDRDSSTQIVVTKSTDLGNSWSTPIRVSDVLIGKSLDTTFGQSFPIIATGPNGQVYVAWNYGPLHSIGFNSSNDGAKTWGQPRLIRSYEWLGVAMNMGSQYNHTLKGGTRVESYPSLVVDTTNSPRRGWLYLTWAADRVPNVYFSRSTDEGLSWSTPKIVHSDTARDQYWQWMALDGSTGDLAVMYLDSRDDPSNKLSRCYVSLSRDGGTTWIDRPVDDVGFDIRRNPFGGSSLSGVFAGDYNGCAFINGRVFPSHVDMRNTYPNIGDNDVYSAVINVNAPMPVSNLRASTLPATPTHIALDWTPPTLRTFGETLASADFVQVLYRDSVFLRQLSGDVRTYLDTTLAAYSSHVYKIVVVAKPLSDSSVARVVTGYAGGAKEPMSADVVSVSNDTTKGRLRVTLPHLRADSVNALINMAKIRIYRDSVQVDEIAVSATDTSKTLDFQSTVPEPGYYDFAVSVVDALGHESARSPERSLYVGPVGNSLSDVFESAIMRRYLNHGQWSHTDEFSRSAPQSLTESARAQYRGLARDTLTLFPLKSTSTQGFEIRFHHAAFVDKGDTAFVEAVFLNKDFQDSVVSILGAYNRTVFAPWADATQNDEDWKAELMHVDVPANTLFALRFRFKSNIVTSAPGWCIDDLSINSGPISVNEENSIASTVYPNPAHVGVNIHCWNNCKLRVSTLLGEVLLEREVLADDIQYLDTELWPSANYILEFQSGRVRSTQVLKVIH